MVTISGGLSSVLDFASDQVERLSGNPVATALGGAVLGASVAGAVAAASNSRSKRRKKASSKKRKSVRKKSKRKSYKYARTAGKRKDKSTRRIRMTKNGQPYVILKSGKARFIKKTSARSSRKRKGGRY